MLLFQLKFYCLFRSNNFKSFNFSNALKKSFSYTSVRVDFF